MFKRLKHLNLMNNNHIYFLQLTWVIEYKILVKIEKNILKLEAVDSQN